MYPESFTGFMIESPETWTDFKKKDHTISGGWGEQLFPLTVGHEIVGRAIKVGDAVKTVKVGDRVGVGAQIYACLNCKQCKNDNETYCKHQKDTYGAIMEADGIQTHGGYSSHVRAHEHFTFPIPEALKSESVAPMLCAGITVYSPLKRNGAGPGKKVGIVGIGGLGHFGIQFSKALGAETWAISRSHAKEADAKKLGADGFIATEDKDWAKPHEMTFDLIVMTANSNENFDLSSYLSLLDVHGKYIMVGLAEGDGQKIKAFDLIGNGCLIGSRKETLEMLDLAAKNGIDGWVETIPISEEGCKQAVSRLHKNDVRYRFVLTDYDKVDWSK